MANEIRLVAAKGQVLQYRVEEPDGTVRVTLTSLPETDTNTGHYVASDTDVIIGDAVMIEDSDGNIQGGGIYGGDFCVIGEDTLQIIEMYRIMFAIMAGKASGGGTTEIKYRNLADTKERITATVNGLGDRSAITLDGT